MKSRIIIVGTSRSGKTTLARKLLPENKKYLDIVDYVMAFIKKENLSQTESDYSLLRTPYENLYQDLVKGKKWDILEIASDFPEEFIPKIVATSKVPIRLIYCQGDLESCLKRNRGEVRQVPEAIIYHQNQYDENYYRALCAKIGLQFSVY